jgi:CheY-like chemotaxis protein
VRMKKILIVEDDQLVATAYKKRFAETGYAVEWASDGLEGIKMVTVVKPDVVLLDLLMPRLDGIEVLKYIRAHPELKHTPVVVFSNSYMTNLVENAWRAGADQCLMKASTTPAQLFDVVNKAIQKAAARKATPEASPTPAPTPASYPAVVPLVPAAPAAPSVRPFAGPVTAGAPVSPLEPRRVSQTSFVVAPTAPGSPMQPEVDPEFQAQIRQLFLAGAPAKLAAVRDAAVAFVQDQGSSMQIPLLADLFRKVHSLTGNAAVSGCAAIAYYSSTFEALLQELQQKPKFINASTVRTVAKAVEFVEVLFQHAETPSPAAAASSILIVDAEETSAQAIALAIEKAGYQSVVVGDPAEALATLVSGGFSGAVIAAALPGMSGVELSAQMRALSDHAGTPVILVTPLAGFHAHASPEVLGENDLLAAPFLLVELALKAVTHVEGRRLFG